jgi:hypothetical protein
MPWKCERCVKDMENGSVVELMLALVRLASGLHSARPRLHWTRAHSFRCPVLVQNQNINERVQSLTDPDALAKVPFGQPHLLRARPRSVGRKMWAVIDSDDHVQGHAARLWTDCCQFRATVRLVEDMDACHHHVEWRRASFSSR